MGRESGRWSSLHGLQAGEVESILRRLEVAEDRVIFYDNLIMDSNMWNRMRHEVTGDYPEPLVREVIAIVRAKLTGEASTKPDV